MGGEGEGECGGGLQAPGGKDKISKALSLAFFDASLYTLSHFLESFCYY